MARLPRAVDARSNNTATSSAGGALAITVPATSHTVGAQTRMCLSHLDWFTNGAPSSQTLTVYDGTSSGTPILQQELGSSGQGHLDFANPIRGTAGNLLTVKLSSGAGRQMLNGYGFPDD